MANRYWVGGTATWDGTAGTKWATTSGGAGGASVPTAADDVFFDANSGTGTVSGSSGMLALSINFTGFTGTFSGGTITVSGNVTLAAGMSIFTTIWTINATSTLTTNGKQLYRLTIDGPGITVTLGSALAVAFELTITNGTFNTSASNYSVTATQLTTTSGGTGAITLNNSTLTLSGTGQALFILSGFTLNASTATIVFSSSVGDISVLNQSGQVFNNITVLYGDQTSFGGLTNCTINGTFTLPAPSAGYLFNCYFNSGAIITISNFVASGSGPTGRIRLYSSSLASQVILSITSYSPSDVDFCGINASSALSGTRLGNCGNNTGITFAAAKTVYWNLAGTQNWSSNGWAGSSGGAPSTFNFPLAQDTAVFDNTGSAGTVTVDKGWSIGTLNASGRTTAMNLTFGANNWLQSGSFLLGSGVTLSMPTGNTVYFVGGANQTITNSGQTWDINAIAITKNAGTVSLGSAFTSTSALSITSGTWDAVTYNCTLRSAFISSGTSCVMGSGQWTLNGFFSVWTCSIGATLTKGTADILLSDTSTNSRTFAGGDKTYNKLTIGGSTGTSTLTITGANTFSEIASTKTVAHTITLPASTTTTVNAFTVAGSAGNVVTINSSSAGSVATLSKSSGIVGVNYLSIRDSTATGGATWYAGANSTNVSNNTGWLFSNAPSLGNMLMLMYPT